MRLENHTYLQRSIKELIRGNCQIEYAFYNLCISGRQAEAQLSRTELAFPEFYFRS